MINKSLVIGIISFLTASQLAAQQPLPNDKVTLPSPASKLRQDGSPGSWDFERSIRSQWVYLDGDVLRGEIGTLGTTGDTLQGVSQLEVKLYKSNDNRQSLRNLRESRPGADEADIAPTAVGITDAQGMFEIANLSPGVYQLVANSEGAFIAYSLILVPGENQLNVNAIDRDPIRLTKITPVAKIVERTRIVAAAVPPTFQTLNSILEKEFPKVEKLGLSQPPDPSEETQGTESLSTSAPNPEHVPGTAINGHTVALLPGNLIVGKLLGIDRKGYPIRVNDIRVYILQNDSIVDSTKAINGEFRATLNGEGAYSIVAIGRDGFGACGFYAAQGVPNTPTPAADLDIDQVSLEDDLHLVSIELAQNPFDDNLVDDSPLDANPLDGDLLDGDLLDESDLIPQPQAIGGGNNFAGNNFAAFPFAMALINDPGVLQNAIPQIGNRELQQTLAVEAPPIGELLAPELMMQAPPMQSMPMQSTPMQAAPQSTPMQSVEYRGGGGRSRIGIAALAPLVALPFILDDDDPPTSPSTP